MTDETHWFRCDVVHYATTDDWGEVSGSYCYVKIHQFEVNKHTPKGAWLRCNLGRGKFVLREMLHRGRAYAAPTKGQAMQDFILRKRFYINRLQAQINRAEQDVFLVRGTLDFHQGAGAQNLPS